MHVIEIIPIGRGIPIDTLSYFSSTPYERGSLLSIPVRNSTVPGVVVGCTEASTMKTALRAATFKLRRLPLQESVQRLSDPFLKTVDDTAAYHATTSGAVLFALLPKEIRNGGISLIAQRGELRKDDAPDADRLEVFQARADARYFEYASLVRESFAARRSVLFVVPTIEHARHAYETLRSGIEKDTVLLDSIRGAKALHNAYERIDDAGHPVLIIATPQYGFIERNDIGLTIIDHARSHGYQAQQRPYVDFKRALALHSKLHKRRTTIGDTLVRTEDEYLVRSGAAVPHEEHPRRIELPGTLKVVSMQEQPDGTHTFTLFSPELVQEIKETLKRKERVFVFAARRGLAPVVACVDCGYILRSPESGAPLSLHRRRKDGIEERWLVCSVSGYRERARDICPSCGGWRLRERGIGIQHVHDELSAIFPNAHTILFDHTTASTPKKAALLRDMFYGEKSGILIGTTMALPYLAKPVGLSAVASLDSLKAIPSWRQQEEALSILLTLREKTHGDVIVQTRSEDDGLLKHASIGGVQAFYDTELALRQTYQYPPESVFIHLTWQGSPEAVKQVAADIERVCAAYNISIYGTPEPQSDETVTRYGLIRVRAADWPNPALRGALAELPPSVRIIINPDRIV